MNTLYLEVLLSTGVLELAVFWRTLESLHHKHDIEMIRRQITPSSLHWRICCS